jgi:hypothetical protein
MGTFKKALMAQGVKPKKEVRTKVDAGIKTKKVPIARLLARLALSRYDRDAPLVPFNLKIEQVRIPLKMHIGAPCKPVVAKGAAVSEGTLIAKPDGLGANIHASINGIVEDISNEIIAIRAAK